MMCPSFNFSPFGFDNAALVLPSGIASVYDVLSDGKLRISFVRPGVLLVLARGRGITSDASPSAPVCTAFVGFGSSGTSQTLSSATPSLSTYFRSPPIPYSPRRNFSLHRSRYFLVRGGSSPRDCSCEEERVKSSSQEENFDACVFSSRPIRVRNVLTSGTNGVGGGT